MGTLAQVLVVYSILGVELFEDQDPARFATFSDAFFTVTVQRPVKGSLSRCRRQKGAPTLCGILSCFLLLPSPPSLLTYLLTYLPTSHPFLPSHPPSLPSLPTLPSLLPSLPPSLTLSTSLPNSHSLPPIPPASLLSLLTLFSSICLSIYLSYYLSITYLPSALPPSLRVGRVAEARKARVAKYIAKSPNLIICLVMGKSADW